MNKAGKKTKRLLLSFLIFIVAGVIIVLAGFNGGKSIHIETTTVKRGSVSNTVSATGTLEAINTVVVGTQVSGVIEAIYVDFNSEVRKGQLLAELDKSILQAGLDEAEAAVYDAKAEYDFQKNNHERNKTLYDKGLIAQADYDLVVYNYKKSEASLKSAQAKYDKSNKNLGYATVYSPIDGVILNRVVEEGQTVTASMNTPELFTIANDLTEMQVEADIDEADIGMVKQGQRVVFTVDAFPDETFNGSIEEVRLQPQEASNVITYTVIVSAPNPEMKLKPGMTASINVFVEEVSDVLTLEGKAIRFAPDRNLMVELMKSLPEDQRPKRGNNQLPESGINPKNGRMQNEAQEDAVKRVWIKEGELIRPVMIETGIDDGNLVEVISGLEANMQVVTGMSLEKKEVEKDESAASNPFMPQRPGRK